MSLSLDMREQAEIAEALRLFASPFEQDSTEAWAGAVVDTARHVLDGVDEDICWLQLPQESDVLDVGLENHPNYTRSLIETYREFEWVHRDTGAFERGARLGVVTNRNAYGPHYETVRQSEYMQEFLPSNGVFDMLALTVPLRNRPRGQEDVVQLILNAGHPDRAFTKHQVQKAKLLYPALRTGVAIHRRFASIRDRLGALLDASGGACALLSLDGRVLHRTPALQQVLMREPRRNELMTYVRQLAVSLDSTKPESIQRTISTTRYVGACGSYTLMPTRVPDLTRLPAILVAVTPPPLQAALPSVEALRNRFGLTPQQARVAQQLAERRTNKEIADALSISIHTARHHVRHVLQKLDVPRRDARKTLCNNLNGATCS